MTKFELELFHLFGNLSGPTETNLEAPWAFDPSPLPYDSDTISTWLDAWATGYGKFKFQTLLIGVQ